MRRLMLLFALLIPKAVAGQDTHPSAREAALRWALAQKAFVLPATVLVVKEPAYRQYHPPQLTTTSEQETSALVAAIGKGARAASGAEALVCIRYDCAARGEAAVVLVRDPETSKRDSTVSGVLVTVYFPGPGGDRSKRTVYSTVVDVKKRGAEWQAVKTRLSPRSPTPVRLRPDSLDSAPL
jgi:hypothetical protein